MRLRTWVKQKGRGAMWQLARATRITYPTIHRIANDLQRPQMETACRISRATGGEVSVDELRAPLPQ